MRYSRASSRRSARCASDRACAAAPPARRCTARRKLAARPARAHARQRPRRRRRRPPRQAASPAAASTRGPSAGRGTRLRRRPRGAAPPAAVARTLRLRCVERLADDARVEATRHGHAFVPRLCGHAADAAAARRARAAEIIVGVGGGGGSGGSGGVRARARGEGRGLCSQLGVEGVAAHVDLRPLLAPAGELDQHLEVRGSALLRSPQQHDKLERGQPRQPRLHPPDRRQPVQHRRRIERVVWPRPAADAAATVGPHPCPQLAVGLRRRRTAEAARQQQRGAPPARGGAGSRSAGVGVGGRGGRGRAAALAALAVRARSGTHGGVQRGREAAVGPQLARERAHERAVLARPAALAQRDGGEARRPPRRRVAPAVRDGRPVRAGGAAHPAQPPAHLRLGLRRERAHADHGVAPGEGGGRGLGLG
eukprot:scaffold100291_cov61-Phaeocystis_antarctica.AAC.1